MKRTAKKLVLPAIAIGLMTMMMFVEAMQRPSSHARAAASVTAR